MRTMYDGHKVNAEAETISPDSASQDQGSDVKRATKLCYSAKDR